MALDVAAIADDLATELEGRSVLTNGPSTRSDI